MSCENCQTCISDAITIQPTNAVFNVTDACNFRCPYCFVEHNPRRATLEIAEKVCQYLLNAPNEGRPTLWFFGGEPMLEFNTIIKPIVEKYTDQMIFGITTNGSLLNEDVVDFFYKHKVSIYSPLTESLRCKMFSVHLPTAALLSKPFAAISHTYS